jgi:aminoglycoside 6'-N-acetyltransferase
VELAIDPAWRDYFIAENDGRPVGIVQIIDPLLEESHYWGSIEPNLRAIDIWIGEESDLGRGFGTKMMTQALEFCFTTPGVTAVVIDPLEANVAARRFYERIGFRAVGPRRFGEDECIVYRLDRDDWIVRHPG